VSLSEDLLSHAWTLFSLAIEDEQLSDITLRRAVSSAYYALFHRINGDAVKLLAPDVPARTNHRIQRWFDHGEMKKICGRFLSIELEQPLRGLLGVAASPEIQEVARRFIELQDARHSADYDLGYVLSSDDAFRLLDNATNAISAWERIQGTAEANIFVLSLLMWKNWDKDR
jgi:hypothetical protein